MDRNSVIGNWRVISFYSEEVDTGNRIYPIGEAPKGYLIYTPEGRMMTLLVAANRKPPQKDEDRIELHKTMYAYSGRYTVEDDRVIHHVDTSWNEAWSGGDQVRFASLNGNRLTIRSAPQPSPHTGRNVASVVEWEREV